MNRFWYIILSLILIINSCKKAEDVTSNNPINTQPTVPLSTDPEVGPGKTGRIPPTREEYNSQQQYIVDPKIVEQRGGRRIARSADLTAEMPLPEFQGTENSCVGFALAYATRSYLYHIDKSTKYYSAQGLRDNKAIFSPRFVYNSLLKQMKTDLDNGSSLRAGLFLLLNQGVCTWDDMPYIAGGFKAAITSENINKATNYKIKTFAALPVDNTTHFVDYIKQVVKAMSAPVVIGMYTDNGFQNPRKNIGNGYELIGQEVVWRKTNIFNGKLGHAVVVVGYDDDKHAFKIMNSYGRNWGNAGYIWMDYDLFTATATIDGKTQRVVDEAYVALTSLIGLVEVPTPVPSGTIDVSLVIDGSETKPRSFAGATYYYKMDINTTEEYDRTIYTNRYNTYLCVFTPDKKVFHKLYLDYNGKRFSKTFTVPFYYAPKGLLSIIIAGTVYADPYYSLFDVKYFPSNSVLPRDDQYYSPAGIYEYAFVYEKEDGTYIKSTRKEFPKPFFDLPTYVGGGTTGSQPTKLFTVNL